jgi:hypothetical protein
VPGSGLDLAPIVDAIEPLPFRAHHHGAEHWRRVAEIAAELVPAVEGADPEVIEAFALLHDAKRRGPNDSEDGPLAAEFARELHAAGKLDLDEAQLDKLAEAFADYPPRTTDDPTVGVCWDACRLDVRRWCQIGPRFFSTEAARQWRLTSSPRRR